MGYTHYWENHATAIPDAALVVLREILDQAYAAGIIQREPTVKAPPLISETVIRFNGVGEFGHEPFSFDSNDPYRSCTGKPFAFCKTAQKPYDKVVMQVLIVLKHFLGAQLRVTSDGRFDDEWRAARAEMEERYGITTVVEERLETIR